MQSSAFQFEDYLIEEAERNACGGTIFRAFRQSENAGRGRRDLLYRASANLAGDVNAVDRVRDALDKALGVSHSGLLATLRCSVAGGELFLVSDWAPAASLADLDSRLSGSGQRWPVPVALHVAREVANTLCHLHSRASPIVHGQVRPENIFITFDGQVKLLGLGMAAAENYALQERQGHAEGAANFASPELAAGREIDGRSDLFSLGAVLWGLIAGRPLFAPSSREEWIRVLGEKTPPPLSQVNPESPAEVDTIAAKLLDRDMYLRYELGERAAQDLSAVLKFRFPDFTHADFVSFCANQTAPFRERYRAYVEAGDERGEETRSLDVSAQASPANAAAPSAPLTPAEAVAARPALTASAIEMQAPAAAPVRSIAPAEIPRAAIVEENFLTDLLSSRWLKPAAAVGVLLLIALPFAGPRFLSRLRSQRAVAQQAHARANEPKGTLHFVTKESGYEVLVNGKPVPVEESTAEVPANRELVVTIRKPGFEEIETVTAVMTGEDLDLPLEFKKSAELEN